MKRLKEEYQQLKMLKGHNKNNLLNYNTDTGSSIEIYNEDDEMKKKEYLNRREQLKSIINGEQSRFNENVIN